MKHSLEALNSIRACTHAVIRRYLDLCRSGDTFKALCPFHSEKTPSFFIRGDRFKCFGCGSSGDIFAFVQKIEGCTFPAAVEMAAYIAGLRIDKTSHYVKPPREPLERNAKRGLHRWRVDMLKRFGIELRDRDALARAAHDAASVLAEGEVWNALEAAYRGYSTIEDRWNRLLDERDYDAVDLWREFGPTAAEAALR